MSDNTDKGPGWLEVSVKIGDGHECDYYWLVQPDEFQNVEILYFEKNGADFEKMDRVAPIPAPIIPRLLEAYQLVLDFIKRFPL